MSDKKPDPNSRRTVERATALTWARGCHQENGCWAECYEAAFDAIMQDDLDDWDRKQATTRNYWHYIHPVAASVLGSGETAENPSKGGM